MNKFQPPFLLAPSDIATAFTSVLTDPAALESLEQLARQDELRKSEIIQSKDWRDFSHTVRSIFATRDHVVIKGLPAGNNGATLLLAAASVCSSFRTYRGGQILKHFKLSPWTVQLSHTIRAGEFHTDLNTDLSPPAITAMQCLDPDPGAPQYGVTRIARLSDLLDYVKEEKRTTALNFLTGATVTMLNDRSSSSWTGHIVEGNLIRYHPETLRAASRRFGAITPMLEERIAEVNLAAMAVSDPFVLQRGDVLLLSNHRTLHYRGECSVIFSHYPSEFTSRSVFILHANQEHNHG